MPLGRSHAGLAPPALRLFALSVTRVRAPPTTDTFTRSSRAYTCAEGFEFRERGTCMVRPSVSRWGGGSEEAA
eukprot:678294-Rhodomonas_salina.1